MSSCRFVASRRRHLQTFSCLLPQQPVLTATPKDDMAIPRSVEPMCHPERDALRTLTDDVFALVADHASSKQWADWLRIPLEHAAASGDLGLVTTLLRAGANGKSGARGCRGRTLLDAAVESGNEKVVSCLLTAGAHADVNVRSGSKRRSALHRAAFLGHDAVSRTLMLAGAEVGLLDSNKRTPLLLAARGSHIHVVYSLLFGGACPNAKDRRQSTALHIAADLGHADMVGALLLKGADTHLADDCGRTPLHLAAEKNHLGAVEVLLAGGADVSHRYGENEISVLDSAAAHGNVDILRAVLRSHGCMPLTVNVDVNMSDSTGYTALHMAADNNEVAAIDALIEAGANIETQDQHNWTPLHSAARYNGCSDALLALSKKHQANVHARDTSGETPLHVACSYLAAGAVDHLLRFGADETAVNGESHTAFEVMGIFAEEDTIGDQTREEMVERVHALLDHAPQDRAWRRRGPFVLCRNYCARNQAEFSDQARCFHRNDRFKFSKKDQGGVAAIRETMRTETTSEAIRRVVNIQEEEMFRMIVGFL